MPARNRAKSAATASASQYGRERNDAEAKTSSTNGASSRPIQTSSGVTKPILSIRQRIASGTSPLIARRSTRFVTPRRSFWSRGSDARYSTTR